MSVKVNPIVEQLLVLRNIKPEDWAGFLTPDYNQLENNDPFLLPDMSLAVDRLIEAREQNQKILIYGDYDADGVTSTALLLDAFSQMGFGQVDYHLPNRFREGYGMNLVTIETIAQDAKRRPDLIVTVDCGSLNHAEVELARKLGMDVIVTDHHSIGELAPPAVAVVNPKRVSSRYPFSQLAGVGVAFSLVRALQQHTGWMPTGQEKWLLDLVAIGTVSDLMELTGENRILTHYGLKVLAKTRRPGLKTLLAKIKANPEELSATTIGFGLGPRFNAAGRMQSAELALKTLSAPNFAVASSAVEDLEFLNHKRRTIQQLIFEEAIAQAEQSEDAVLVLAGEKWHEGVVGIVASNLQEMFARPVFVFQNSQGILKGSARSFGDYSIFEAINQARDLILQGGGHAAAGGVKLKEENLAKFRQRVNQYYHQLKLNPTKQAEALEPQADLKFADWSWLDLELFNQISRLEPFGLGNPEPVFEVEPLEVAQIRLMGSDNQHAKLWLKDRSGQQIAGLVFNTAQEIGFGVGAKVQARFSVMLNRWQGKRELELKILKLVEL